MARARGKDGPAGLLLLVLLLLALPAGWAGAAEWPDNAYVLRVDGLACPYCGYGIEKQFARKAGVRGTAIDVERGVVVVSVAPGTRFSDRELEQIVHAAGFALAAIVRRPPD